MQPRSSLIDTVTAGRRSPENAAPERIIAGMAAQAAERESGAQRAAESAQAAAARAASAASAELNARATREKKMAALGSVGIGAGARHAEGVPRGGHRQPGNSFRGAAFDPRSGRGGDHLPLGARGGQARRRAAPLRPRKSRKLFRVRRNGAAAAHRGVHHLGGVSAAALPHRDDSAEPRRDRDPAAVDGDRFRPRRGRSRRVAKKYPSEALEADALHFSTDVWSTFVVVLGHQRGVARPALRHAVARHDGRGRRARRGRRDHLDRLAARQGARSTRCSTWRRSGLREQHRPRRR